MRGDRGGENEHGLLSPVRDDRGGENEHACLVE